MPSLRAPEKDSTSSPLSWRFWMLSLRLQKMRSIKSRKHSAFTADTVKIPELTPEFIVIQKTQNRQNNREKCRILQEISNFSSHQVRP